MASTTPPTTKRVTTPPLTTTTTKEPPILTDEPTTVVTQPSIKTTSVHNETSATTNTTVTPPMTSSTPDVTQGQVDTDGQGSSNVGIIVGGVIGGIVVIALILAVIVFIKRRQGRQNRNSLHKLPGKEDLEIHVPPAPPGSASYNDKPYTDKPPIEKPYANITVSGETDEHTDPSVDHDGYIKKTKHYHKENKNCKSNGSTGDELPLYGNEDFKPKTRVDSMPVHRAPTPPGGNKISGYSTARVGETKLGDTASGYSDARVPANVEPVMYMEVVADHQNSELDGASGNDTNQSATSGDKTPDKIYVNERVLNPSNAESESTRLYENIDKRDYKTVTNNTDSDKVNKEQTNATTTPYANVGTVPPDSLEQDNEYEIP